MKLLPALLLLLCSPAPAAAADGLAGEPQIRVAIFRNSPALKLKTSAKLYVQEVKSGQKYMLLDNASYEVKSEGRGITVAGQELSSPIKLLAADGQERIRLGGNLYKGDILLRATPEGKLDIIEYLPLEDYLYGVLPSEMSPDWPLEALKAQAVASRTYALRYINPARDYDVTDGVEMQVYKGTAKISPRIIEAVNSTRGEVLKYKGKLVSAFFHACCGGHTASVRSAWGEDIIKPLYGAPDPFCSPSRHYRWEYYLASSELLKYIQAAGSTALKVKSLRIHKKDRSGRAVSFLVGTDKGSKTVQATEMRKRFGTFEFRSTYVTSITPVKGGFEISGRGWGHGVGMCQEGAKYMALKGRPYKKILRHYYPGAAILDYE
ncbi:MAG: SpoIID/LytB domain-containing protein [Elusimicrobiales bacterium]|nr:SpoIID/LytB domain-containing protein [Elusimicrobiales bacterium]